jgi:preprotein translocase subunit SecA
MGEEPDLIEAEDKDDYGYKYVYYYEPDDGDQDPIFWKRKDYPDIVYRSVEAKLRAIVKEIIYYHVIGRPQLVGTTSVENSEFLSERLNASNIRRLMEVLLVRHAYMKHHNLREDDALSMPDLDQLNQPLDKLRSVEMRRLGRDYGLQSLSPLDESNQQALLEIFDLSPEDWERLEAVVKAGVQHQVLNARKHTEESKIIASAGAFGAVTLATNMAGRGVDIKLGGELSEENLTNVNRLLAEEGEEDPYNMQMQSRLLALQRIPPEAYGDYAQDVQTFFDYMEEMKRVRELGGLHVIGSERHEARRIDNQLRGRAARQGDPGSSRFFLSLEDDLMRLFGGGQVEALLSRLNIDEGVPIESGIVGRLVESSQKRVEGANFDVRKHLLEYDDVLNSQRERIYQQRERIFNKEDLREDVTEMLRTEVSRRIDEGMQDEEGPWKLMAYLEDTQPPMDLSGLTHPSYSLKLMMDRLGHQESVKDLQDELLRIASDALYAWHDHLRNWAESLIAQSEMSFENQFAERTGLLDTFVEGLAYGEVGQSRNISSELSELLHVPLRLSDEIIQGLYVRDKGAIEEVEKQVSSTLMQIYLRRLILTFERRLNDNWNIQASDLASESWGEVRKTLFSRVNDTLGRREEYVLGDSGEIAQDIKSNQEMLEAALQDPSALMRLLLLITQGRVITFDDRTHKRMFKASRRLTYIFLAAQQLEQKPVEELQQDILRHLETAQDKLALVWGEAELTRLHNAGHTLGQLTQSWQDRLIAQIGQDDFERLKSKSIDTFSEEDQESLAMVLGGFAQNRLYRQLLLSKISELWVEYLTKVEALRVSVKLEAYGQKDPLVVYRSEASTMFSELLSDIRAGVIAQMFRARMMSQEDLKKIRESAKQAALQPEKDSTKKKKKKSRKRH